MSVSSTHLGMIVLDRKTHLILHIKPYLMTLFVLNTKPHLILLYMKPHSMTMCLKDAMTLNLWLKKMVTVAVGHAASLNLVFLIQHWSGFGGFCVELMVAAGARKSQEKL